MDLIDAIATRQLGELQQLLDDGYALTGDRCHTLVLALKILGFTVVVERGQVRAALIEGDLDRRHP